MGEDNKPILIVGDWVVDDSWQTGTYRSRTSLREGKWHLRAEPNEFPTVAFCGAGRVASLLRNGSDGRIGHPILGLGAWYAGDTEFLKSLFDFEYRKTLSPDKIWDAKPKDTDGVVLHNIGGEQARTTRAFRTYTTQAGQLTVEGRIDWETPLPPANEMVDRAKDILKSVETVKGVVIKDISKGVVNRRLINFLAEKYRGCPWFVSTKSWDADWLKSLASVPKLNLVLFHPVAAHEALLKDLEKSKVEPIDSWIVPGQNIPTYGACESIIAREKLLTNGNDREPIIVIGQEEGEVVAKKGEKCVVGRFPSLDYGKVGWASAFFASMIDSCLGDNSTFPSSVNYALTYAEDWAEVESGFLRADYQSAVEARKNEIPVIGKTYPSASENRRLHDGNWRKVVEEWQHVNSQLYLSLDSRDVRQTSKGSLPGTTDVGVIELWRAMTLLPGYVCLDPDKRRGISRILRLLREVPSEQHALEIDAEPGSGKSYLVRCMAEAANLDLIEFNVTNLHSRDQLVTCFDKIATHQAENKNKRLLVFFDEINAGISGDPIYDAFLAPLEDSVYLRELMKFHLLPCFWLFVGTKLEKESRKYEDFSNRMMGEAIHLGPLTEAERKYAGVQLIRQRFPDVQRVSVDVLNELGKLKGSVRDIKRWVRSLENVRERAVRRRNVPNAPEKFRSTEQTLERMVLID